MSARQSNKKSNWRFESSGLQCWTGSNGRYDGQAFFQKGASDFRDQGFSKKFHSDFQNFGAILRWTQKYVFGKYFIFSCQWIEGNFKKFNVEQIAARLYDDYTWIRYWHNHKERLTGKNFKNLEGFIFEKYRKSTGSKMIPSLKTLLQWKPQRFRKSDLRPEVFQKLTGSGMVKK